MSGKRPGVTSPQYNFVSDIDRIARLMRLAAEISCGEPEQRRQILEAALGMLERAVARYLETPD